jgi:pilus assembly protein CpaB
MRRGSRILLLFLLVIIVLGAGAFFLLRGNLLAGPAPTPTAPPITIVVAGQPIPRDSEITAEALSSMPYSLDGMNDQLITNPDDLLGLYAKYPIAQGMPITRDMLSERPGILQPGSEAAKVIPPGLTAISIPISRLSAVAYAIRDGDHVDVIATTAFIDVDPSFQSSMPNLTAVITGTGILEGSLATLTSAVSPGGPQGRTELDPTLNQAFYVVPSEAQRSRLVSQMILQNIQVLKVGDFALVDTNTSGFSSATPTPVPTPQPGEPVVVGAPGRPDLVTLIVTPQDAVTLTYLIYSNAKLTLTLRPPDDGARVETEAATLQYLLSQYAIPVPAKLPYALNPRVDAPVDPRLPNDAIAIPAQ